MKINLATWVTMLILKSQFFTINIDKADSYQMFIFFTSRLYSPVKLKCLIMPNAMTFLFLINFALICNCFLKTSSGNILTWLNGKHSNIIPTNPTLSTIACLCKFCIEHNTIQRGQNHVYHGTIHLHKNIIWACRDNFAFITSFINSSPNIWDLINNLYILTINYKAIHKPNYTETYIQSDTNWEDDNEIFFIDR